MEAIAIAEIAKVYGPPGAVAGLIFFYAIRAIRSNTMSRDYYSDDLRELKRNYVEISIRLARIEGRLGVEE